ncbi:MAG: DUF2169 domain-containing protein, partial [Archangium sp.]|nr:DUF2169 domain-containing protein [Archangium sp.]
MWNVLNGTPYSVERSIETDVSGRQDWVVVTKATFSVEPDGSLSRAPDQLPVLLAEEHRGDPAT